MYKLFIERDDEIIFGKGISADTAINYILQCTDLVELQEAVPDEAVAKDIDVPSKPKKKYKKRVKDEPVDDIEERPRKNKQATCSRCGVVGHRSDRCPGAENAVSKKPLLDVLIDEDEAVAEGALDSMQFTQVKELKHKELSTREVSDELDLDRDEVTMAFSALTYQGYLKLR